MAKAGRTCVDRWEAHLVTLDAGGGVAVHPHNERPAAGVRYEARTAPGVFPQAYVSRVEAKAACVAAGKRLCSVREWTRACEGPKGKTFPYGRRPVRGRCNAGKPHLLAAKYGADSRRWRYDEHFNDPALDVEPGFLAKAGEHEGCASDDGVFDLVGNLHEWVGDTVDADFVERFEDEKVTRRKQPWKPGNGVFLGGFFSTTDEHGPGCTFATIAHEPTYHDYSVGFRCCAPARTPPADAAATRRGPKR
jgi:formylglycine-generating enzyme required for sulfatase activity